VVLVLNPRGGELAVSSVMRLETQDDRVSLIRVYAMCSDTVREVAEALGRPYGSMGMYHLPRAILAMIEAAQSKQSP
jgi:hypothetical protein